LSAGQPLAGVKVQIFRPVIENSEQTKYQSWASAEMSMTDHKGVYEFPFLEPGKQLYVSVERASHNSLHGERFDLVAGQDKELATISLNRLDRFLSGVVVDPRGRFVEGARVTASFADGRPLMRIRGVRDVRSGADGRFELDELPNEPLEIMAYFDPPEGDMTIRFPARVEVAADAKEVRLVLDPKLSRPR
jgi:hypothetical protein